MAGKVGAAIPLPIVGMSVRKDMDCVPMVQSLGGGVEPSGTGRPALLPIAARARAGVARRGITACRRIVRRGSGSVIRSKWTSMFRHSMATDMQ